jgi:hypothetical protein
VSRLGLPPNPKTAEQIGAEVELFFAQTREAKARMPVMDDSEEEADETSRPC